MRSKRFYFVLLALILLTMTGYINLSFTQPQNVEAQDKLNQITEEEQAIIEALFVLSSEIELLNTELLKLGQDILQIEAEVEQKNIEIHRLATTYESLKSNLAEVLRIQQRSGIASNLEILLKSKDLKDFVSRINLLRDLSKNVDNLMKETDFAKSSLERERANLNEMLVELENQEALLVKKAEDKNMARLELEAYLDSLESEKEHYEAYLDSIEKIWNDLKPLFSLTIKSFTQIIEKGDMPEDTVEVVLSLFNTRGIIREVKFNQILSQRSDLPELKFDFKSDGVVLKFPSHEVELNGTFELVDNQTIKYVVKGGQFYKLPMSQSALADLFSEGDLVFNLKSILGKNTIRRIDYYEDRLELQVTISLF
ncbi:MAG TPA: hypothetical protein DCS67_06875 [Clostridiales bacterium UBA8960]|nr:hypothetical protein [Clostridiales bacterium UBA8960]